MGRHAAVTVDLESYSQIGAAAAAWSEMCGHKFSRTDVVRMGLALLAREMERRMDAKQRKRTLEDARRRDLAGSMLEGDNDEALFFDGLDKAIVGVARRCGQLALVVYDRAIIVKELMAQGMDETEAEEFLEFNIAGAWVGENTPLILSRVEDIDE